MSSPDDGSELRPASERSTGGTGVSAPRGNDVVTSPGASRTPPPRGRRGAPPSRNAAPDLVEPEPAVAVAPAPAAKPTSAKSTTAKSTGTKSTTSQGGPKAASGSSKTFDWDIDDPSPAPVPTAGGNAATVAMTTGVAEIAEPEASSGQPTPAPRERKGKAAKRPERRFRQTIQKVDLWSVTKIALCFYVSAMAVLMVSMIALWVVADSAGIIDNVENFVGDLFSSEDFQFVSGQALRGAVLGGVVMVALMVVLTIVGASFYNIFAELFGGIEIVIREEEQPPKR